MYKLLIAISLLFGIVSNPLQAQNKVSDDYLQKVFTLLKNNDTEGYRQLFPTMAKMKEMMAYWGSRITDTPAKKQWQEFISMFNEDLYEKALSNSQQSFSDLLYKGRASGINWADIQFDGSTYKEEVNSDIGIELKQLQGTMSIKYDTGHYTVYFNDGLWFEPDQKWFGIKLSMIDPATEAMQNNALDSVMMMDTVAKANEEVMNSTTVSPSAKTKKAKTLSTTTSSQPRKKTATIPVKKSPAIKPKNKVKP